MNSINGNVLSNNYFLDRRQKISSDKLKQTSHINRKKINNSHCSIKQLKSNPSDYLILFKMNPLRQTTINESLIKPLDAQEVKDVVKKLHKNGKYKELPFIKHLCQKNSGHIKDIEKAIEEQGTSDVFLLFATGHKPGYLVDIPSLNSVNMNDLPRGYKNIGGFILNEVKTRKVIDKNYEWLKLLLKDENITKDGIFDLVTSSDKKTNPLLKSSNTTTMNEAVKGIFLGYPPVSSIIFEIMFGQPRTSADCQKFVRFTNKDTFLEHLKNNECDKLKNYEKLRNKLIDTLNNYEGDDFIKDESIPVPPKKEKDFAGQKACGLNFCEEKFNDDKFAIFPCKIFIHEPEAEEDIMNEIKEFVQENR